MDRAFAGRIAVELDQIGAAAAPVVIHVRLPEDFSAINRATLGAIRRITPLLGYSVLILLYPQGIAL